MIFKFVMVVYLPTGENKGHILIWYLNYLNFILNAYEDIKGKGIQNSKLYDNIQASYDGWSPSVTSVHSLVKHSPVLFSRIHVVSNKIYTFAKNYCNCKKQK